MKAHKKSKFIYPANLLKQKVGDGGIPAETLKKSQDFLENNPVDFTPYAQGYLDKLISIRDFIVANKLLEANKLAEIENSVMQLKSNGSMFHYNLISMVSDVMLRLIEKVGEPNPDFNAIFLVYTNIISSIITKKLRGTGGEEGTALVQELQAACLRYYKKHDINF